MLTNAVFFRLIYAYQRNLSSTLRCTLRVFHGPRLRVVLRVVLQVIGVQRGHWGQADTIEIRLMT